MADPSDGRLEAIVLEALDARAASCGCWRAPARGSHLDRPGVTWHGATRAQLLEPLPLVADAQPLGVTTAAVTVARRPAAPDRRGGAAVSTMSFAIRRPAPRTAAAALWAFATVAVALGAARAVTTTYVPVLLERIADRPA